MREDIPPIDDAIETAVHRTREAEEKLLGVPLGTDASVERAYQVAQRVEEVEELAIEAVEAPALPHRDDA